VVALDAGQVLVTFDFERANEKLYAHTGKRLSLPLPPQLEEVFRKAEIEGDAWERTARAVAEHLGVDLSLAEWVEIWCSIFTGQVPGMEEVLRDFREDFRFVALSNTCKVHWEFVCRSYPIMSLLEGWVVSYEVGAAKPDPAIYRALSEKFTGGRPPLFFTDDMPAFVEGARRVGWRAEVFRGASWLAEVLREAKKK